MNDFQLSIRLVLLFSDDDKVAEWGPALWATLGEVAALYRRAARFRHVAFEQQLLVGQHTEVPSKLAVPRGAIHRVVNPAEWWFERMAPTRRTFDQTALAQAVRLIVNAGANEPVVVLTDAEITPPRDWRYIIWDGAGMGAVVSVAPLDPAYWGSTEARVPPVKQRARAACCSVVGGLLGLERCDRPRCFLLEPIDSSSQLDHMTHLGGEHGIPELTGIGFDSEASGDPAILQEPHLVASASKEWD